MPVAEALAAGFTRACLRTALRRGLLRAPRRGLLVVGSLGPTQGVVGPTWEAEHRQATAAALTVVGPSALVSHDSAAVLHGLGRPSSGPPPVVSLIRPGAVSFDGPGLRVRGTGVPISQRAIVDGLPATSMARTAVDLARGRRLPGALVSLDSAARLLVASATSSSGNGLRRAAGDVGRRSDAREALETALSACFGWPGTVAVRDALRDVDPAAESPLESRSRGWFLDAGLRGLIAGHPVDCGETTYWADFCDPVRRVIGEADGWSKYGSSLTDFRAALERERERQRRLEGEGWAFVRWTSTEGRPAVVARMARALGPSGRTDVPVTGGVVDSGAGNRPHHQ